MARPSKFNTDVKPRFSEIEEWLKIGATDKEVAENLGINKATFCEYKKRFPELNELLKNARKMPVQAIKAALFKRATGFSYSEKKTVVEYEELSADLKDALRELGYDPAAIGQRKLVRIETMEKYALPDPASGMILLKHWDKDQEWTQDPASLNLKKQELELKKKHMESEDW